MSDCGSVFKTVFDDDCLPDSVDALRRSLSADDSGSDSGSQSHDEDAGTTSGSSSTSVEPSTSRLHSTRSRHHGDPDRRARRAIANSNERRRMQSINAGFQSLHELVKPRHGEKLSKAAILQRAVDYIADLHRQKAQLVAKNTRLVQLLATGTGNTSRPEVTSAAKRRRLESLSSDEGADTPSCGPRRRRSLQADRREADRNLYDGAEDLRIPSLPVAATLPVAAEVSTPQPPASSAASVGSSLLTLSVPSTTHDDDVVDQSSTLDRSSLPSFNASPSSSSDQLWSSSTSRRNLETILEAIRHLEGEATSSQATSSDLLSPSSLSLMTSSYAVQFTPTKTCVAVRSS